MVAGGVGLVVENNEDNAKVSEFEAQQQAARVDSKMALKEQIDVFAKSQRTPLGQLHQVAVQPFSIH